VGGARGYFLPRRHIFQQYTPLRGPRCQITIRNLRQPTLRGFVAGWRPVRARWQAMTAKLGVETRAAVLNIGILLVVLLSIVVACALTFSRKPTVARLITECAKIRRLGDFLYPPSTIIIVFSDRGNSLVHPRMTYHSYWSIRITRSVNSACRNKECCAPTTFLPQGSFILAC